jgi:hypothetical protein
MLKLTKINIYIWLPIGIPFWLENEHTCMLEDPSVQLGDHMCNKLAHYSNSNNQTW